MKRIIFKEEAERLNVPQEAVVKIFYKLLDERKFYGIIDTTEFIGFTSEEIDDLIKLLDSKPVQVNELAKELNLTTDQLRRIIDKLLDEDRIKGLLKEEEFVPQHVITEEAKESKREIEKLTTLCSRGEIAEESKVVIEMSAEKIMAKHFPKCPICKLDAGYEFPSTEHAQCKNCKAKWRVESGYLTLIEKCRYGIIVNPEEPDPNRRQGPINRGAWCMRERKPIKFWEEFNKYNLEFSERLLKEPTTEFFLTKDEQKLLTNSICVLMGIANTSLTVAIVGTIDPLSGLWLQSTRVQMTMKDAKENIEDLYVRHPIVITAYVKNPSKLAGILKPILEKISKNCPFCEEMIPKAIEKCPYCLKALKNEEKVEEEPLQILRLRYAKGEITKEEYEEMKKILGS